MVAEAANWPFWRYDTKAKVKKRQTERKYGNKKKKEGKKERKNLKTREKRHEQIKGKSFFLRLYFNSSKKISKAKKNALIFYNWKETTLRVEIEILKKEDEENTKGKERKKEY